MSFVYPSFLWALTTLSIPIIIHLFNFRKTQRIYFSSTRFLQQVQEATSAKRKLKHYLILASRLLFLFFLVIAFAQPFLPADEQFSTNRNIAIYLDNSLSMSVPVGEKIRALDAGIGYARQIAEVFPPDTRYQLITNDFAPFSNSYKAKTELLDLLTQVRLSPISRSVTEVKERLDNISRNEQDREVFWISDFQRSTSGTLGPQLFDSTYRLHLIPMEFQPHSNIFIDTAYLENPFVVGGEKNTLHVKLRNDGAKSIEQLLVKLTINGIQTGTGSVTIPAKGVSETAFDLVTGLNTISRAVISFNDYPVSFDNEFYLALNFSEKVRVIEIKGTTGPTPIENVFGNKEVFLFRSFQAGNMNYSMLQEADLVVMNGLDRVDASLLQSVQNYVSDGGTLLLIPSAHPDIPTYRDLLRLSTLRLAEGNELVELDYPDFNNPFFENVFEERSTRLTMPRVRRVLDWGFDRSALLKLKNDQPFLSQFRVGGKLYVLASPLESEYSELSGNFLFLPVMYRIAASGKRVDWKPYSSLNESLVTIRLDSTRDEQVVRLAGQQEIIPSQRNIGDRVLLDLPRFTMNAGFYHAIHATDTLGLLAFNLDNRESLLDQMTGEEVMEQLGAGENINLFKANSEEAFSNEIKARYLGTPLWKYALMLALFFLLVEILLIRFLK